MAALSIFTKGSTGTPLGAGGMGEVYRAKDARLDRAVTIKVLTAGLSSDAPLKQRMEREAKAISKILHPHICALHDIGHQDGIDFLVMEYLEREMLERRLTQGALPPGETLPTPHRLPTRWPKRTSWGSPIAI
jgi:eukaryotic-like serine/threonine-protein kinase